MIEEARHDAEQDRRAAARPGRRRAGTHQGPRCTTGSAVASAADPRASQSLGEESVHRAGDMVREFVSDPEEQSATVDRFLDELDEMAPSNEVFEDAVTAKLRSASRESVAQIVGAARRRRRRSRCRRADDIGQRSGLGGQTGSPGPLLARHLSDPSSSTDTRVQLVERLLSGKVSDPALSVLKNAASQRWSSDLRPDLRNTAHRQPGSAGARRA